MRNWLVGTLFKIESDLDDFKDCMKLYIAMQEWFHETNQRDEVKSSRPLIAIVINGIHTLFPRDVGQGWKLHKPHGLARMQYYMRLFGSGINCLGGLGECNHRKFVNNMADNTQCQIGCFPSQADQRY